MNNGWELNTLEQRHKEGWEFKGHKFNSYLNNGYFKFENPKSNNKIKIILDKEDYNKWKKEVCAEWLC